MAKHSCRAFLCVGLCFVRTGTHSHFDYVFYNTSVVHQDLLSLFDRAILVGEKVADYWSNYASIRNCKYRPVVQMILICDAFTFTGRTTYVELYFYVVLRVLIASSERDPLSWNLSPDEVQRRRVLFWELYTFEAWTVRFTNSDQWTLSSNTPLQSVAYGRPPSLNIRFADCRFPEDRDPGVGPSAETELGCMFDLRPLLGRYTMTNMSP